MSAEAVYDEVSGDVTVTGHHNTEDADRAAAACAGDHGRVTCQPLADRGRRAHPPFPGPVPDAPDRAGTTGR